MDSLLILLNIAIMLIMVGVLIKLQRKHVSFTKRVFAGLGLGIVFGFALNLLFKPDSEVIQTSTQWFGIIGNGYVAFLKMIIMPLIIVSIVSAIINIKDTKGLGKIGGFIIGTLIITTLISAVVGIASTLGFGLSAESMQFGEAEKMRGEQLEQRAVDVENYSIPSKIVDFIPSNPFLDMTGGRSTSTIGVVIFSAFVGIAVLGVRRKKPEQAELFTKIVNAVYEVVMRMVKLILRLTPYGILALITNAIASTSFDSIINLSTFVVASYVAMIIMFGIHLLIVFGFGLNPITFAKKILPLLTFAFTSRSSAGAIPLHIQTGTEKFGVSRSIANFAATFGATIGQNGCAGIYPAMVAVMIAPTVGIDPLDPAFLVKLAIIVAISSFGVAGVGGGATFATLIVLSTMNLPVALVGLLISVEPLIDMGRTALNVSGSMTAGVVTSKALKEMDEDVYNSDSKTGVAESV